jgi:acyl carrier protein
LFDLTSDIAERFHIGSGTKTLLNTPISFDVSLAEIFMTLCGGGQLIVADTPLVGSRLAEFIAENEITHLATTPSLLATVPLGSLPSLECIISAGEACPQQLIDAWAEGRLFFNAYGPTEATVYATAAQCHAGAAVTIGKALSHVRTYVMDQNLLAVQPGEPGELCLGGSGVADGYIGNDEESRKKFVDLSFGSRRQSERIYRTGDVVRLDADGDLLFLGRLDNQIKIRGIRIEIEEIEHSIKRIPGIVEAAVCVDESVGTTKELLCFAVTDSSEEFDAGDVSGQLSAWLPSSMIPTHIVRVDAIPLTANGKKDRRTALSRYRSKIVRRAEFISGPRNEVESELLSIWQAALEVNVEIGVYDDFFALGGDSLKSLILITEVERTFGITAPPGFFGGLTTICCMAVQLADLLWDRDGQNSAVESGFQSTRIYKQLRHLTVGWAGRRLSEDSLISSLGEARPDYDVFLCCQYEAEFIALSKELGAGFRVHCMRSGHLVMEYTQNNIGLLASRYAEEIEQIGPTGRLLIVGNCQGAVIAHAVARRLLEAGAQVSLLVVIELDALLPYVGPIAFIYAENSFLNPLKSRKYTFANYTQVYADNYSIDVIPGEHGGLLAKPKIQFVVAKIRNSIYPGVSRASAGAAISRRP